FDSDIDIHWVNSELVTEASLEEELKDSDGIVVPGGFGTRGMDGKLITIRYARENNIPFLGVGIGMQLAAVEFARNVLDLADAHAIEVNPNTPHPITRFTNENGNKDALGGTLRLGIDDPISLKAGTKAAEIYGGLEEIAERHRNRYELNPIYREQFEDNGLVFSAYSRNEQSIEVIEIKDHTWFLACQYHPQFKSRPTKAHPLISGFIEAVVTEKYKKE
ncbi:MAG TPA: gamma-glutamyl-gamma-aminobutyrate hydrolase family protein, partial [Pseudogracilibacillus sp.]|nr:gamma-glutamyl-gamma-aminobutyrate hydrolase family protein [Pseudogracilibacillus sp.]